MNGDLLVMFDAFYPIVMITLGLGVGYALGVLHGRKIEHIASQASNGLTRLENPHRQEVNNG